MASEAETIVLGILSVGVPFRPEQLPVEVHFKPQEDGHRVLFYSRYQTAVIEHIPRPMMDWIVSTLRSMAETGDGAIPVDGHGHQYKVVPVFSSGEFGEKIVLRYGEPIEKQPAE